MDTLTSSSPVRLSMLVLHCPLVPPFNVFVSLNEYVAPAFSNSAKRLASMLAIMRYDLLGAFVENHLATSITDLFFKSSICLFSVSNNGASMSGKAAASAASPCTGVSSNGVSGVIALPAAVARALPASMRSISSASSWFKYP